MRNHRAIGQITDPGFVPRQAFGMKFGVKFRHFDTPKKTLRLGPAAEETGPMARGQGRYLVKEEQRRITLAHGFVLHVLVVQIAAYPVDAGPAALSQGLIVTVKLATAIAHHESTRRHRDDATVGLNAVLQGHGREPEWRRRVGAA